MNSNTPKTLNIIHYIKKWWIDMKKWEANFCKLEKLRANGVTVD